MAKAKKVKGLANDATVIKNARRIIAVRLNEMYQFAPYVTDPENIEEIHNLRIAAKRLRYTLEMFRFAFPKELKGYISEVKEIQSAIGTMRDADIMVENVLHLLDERARARSRRLRDIATAAERGTIAQRKQRIGEAMSARTVLRDDIAYYTLIAHQSDISTSAYRRFLVTWRVMQESDFYGRLRQFIGIDPPEIEETDDVMTHEEPIPEEQVDIVVEPGE